MFIIFPALYTHSTKVSTKTTQLPSDEKRILETTEQEGNACEVEQGKSL
jgi:hypothetical protein